MSKTAARSHKTAQRQRVNEKRWARQVQKPQRYEKGTPPIQGPYTHLRSHFSPKRKTNLNVERVAPCAAQRAKRLYGTRCVRVLTTATPATEQAL